MPDRDTYDRLRQHTRETALLGSIAHLLEWDERTMMPPAAGAFRAEQLTYLAGVIHERRTDPAVGEWLEALADSALAADRHGTEATNIRQLRRDYEKQRKRPVDLVRRLTHATVVGQQQWQAAREADDFETFRPYLETIFALKREEAAAIGYDDDPYDPLLDDYEPDATSEEVERVLTALERELVPLVEAIQESGRRPDRTILARAFPIDAQAAFAKDAAAAIGFDFDAGRLDVTAHPFCTGLGPGDCRITTRYLERYFPSAFFGVLHEAGHGIYEQGLDREQYGLPAGESISLGIHESQSRTWENAVGRSLAFWRHFYPSLQTRFDALAGVSLEDFHFAINDVRPSLIRVEADEATYNLHILLRFRLERALVADTLSVGDLPGAWRDEMKRLLGVAPDTDADGVLQDIHWSAGLVGYFPTYSLGNLYGAQFFEQADEDLGGLHAQFERGEFTPLRTWLNEKIHRPGQRYGASELVQRVTGSPLSHEPLMRHLRSIGDLFLG